MTSLKLSWPRALPLATLAVTGIWVLIAVLNWHQLGRGVRIGFPRVDNDYAQPLLFSTPIQMRAVLGVILLQACSALLGYRLVVRSIWGRRRLAGEAWLLVAGIIPGNLILIVLARLITLALPNTQAPLVVCALTLSGSAGVIWALRKDMARETVGWRWRDALPIAGLAVTLLVFGIQFDRFHVMGEASSWFINDIYTSGSYGIGRGYFPLISQHYDEAALLYPVIYGFVDIGADKATVFTLYWFMAAFGRLSILGLCHLSLRSFGVDKLSAFAILVFVSIGTLSLNPISSRLLADSLSPLIFTLHIARFLIPVAPLILMSVLKLSDQQAPSVAALGLAAVLGAGLSSMPVQTVLVIAWGLPVALLTQLRPTASGSTQLWQGAALAALIVLVCFMATYGVTRTFSAELSVGILFAATLAGGLVVLVAWFACGARWIPSAWRSRPVLLVACLAVGYGFGVLFLGNVFIHMSYSLLAPISPFGHMQIADREISQLGSASGKFMLSTYCAGYVWGLRTLAGHCNSLPMFVRTYGLTFAVMSAALVWPSLAKTSYSRLPGDQQTTLLLVGIVLCLLALPICFIAFDFIAPAQADQDWQRSLSIWLRSRLVEPWFYSGLIFGLILLLEQANSVCRRNIQSVLLIAAAIGGLTPLVLPGQMVVNFEYLVQSALR
jgi:hypothetical protein